MDLFTGLRSGELIGLTWDCIDFDKGIPARSTVDCTGFPRIHDEPPVIADECSGSIHAILSTCVHRWRRANTAQGAEGGDSAN